MTPGNIVTKWLTRDVTFSLLGFPSPFSCPSTCTEKCLDRSGFKVQVQVRWTQRVPFSVVLTLI